MNRIAELRKKQKLSQHQFSKLLNVAQNTISQWETGHRDVDSTTLIKIAEFFKVSTDYLLGLTDTASPIVKEKTPSYQEEVIQDLEDITPDMASEIRQYISYLKHKKEAATNTVAEKK
jgi:DNA-binding protein